MTQPPKRGLGKGLGALLGNASVPVTPRAEENLRDIAVDRITPNPHQPRKHFDAQALEELRSSIAQYGVLVPILVRARGERFELIAGERRWRASALAAKTTIPAIVRTSDDRDSLEVAIVENLQREDLNPLEEAAGYAHLMDEYALTQDEVAQRLGKSRPAVANALRLLTLDDGVKALLVSGSLSAGHARALLSVPPARRLMLAQRVIAEGMSVRALENAVAQKAAPMRPASERPRDLSTDERDFESRLRERYGTHVSLVRRGRGGRIELRFADERELMRLGDLLLDLS